MTERLKQAEADVEKARYELADDIDELQERFGNLPAIVGFLKKTDLFTSGVKREWDADSDYREYLRGKKRTRKRFFAEKETASVSGFDFLPLFLIALGGGWLLGKNLRTAMNNRTGDGYRKRRR